MLSLGPLPIHVFVLMLALLAATLAARLVARRMPGTPVRVFSLFVDMLLVTLLAGRLVFVIQWWPLYMQDPWAIIKPGDGGYSITAAIIAAVSFALWKARRVPALRKPLAWGGLTGLATWFLLAGALLLMQRATITLPETGFARMEGGSVQLAEFRGRPMVVNLWATWCPPCRREMPVLAEAQRDNPEISFVFVNQGEAREQIQQYLQSASLHLQNVLVDPFSHMSQAAGARGLPVTLFFDAHGRLVDTHMGELTRAALAQKLERHSAARAASAMKGES